MLSAPQQQIQGVCRMAADYIVKDIALADFGRKELTIAETEMPGLMACREEFGPTQPLNAARFGRRCALGLVQHLLDPRSRCSGHCRLWHAGVRH
jgi:hypothetical protein